MLMFCNQRRILQREIEREREGGRREKKSNSLHRMKMKEKAKHNWSQNMARGVHRVPASRGAGGGLYTYTFTHGAACSVVFGQFSLLVQEGAAHSAFTCRGVN